MKVHVINAAAVTPQPWRNGGGMTRELWVWPAEAAAPDWRVRITLAEVAKDGPFSAFPGVLRRFAVVGGCGLSLRWAADGPWQDLEPGHAPIAFDGALAPDCRLLERVEPEEKKSTDLNLMTRHLASSMLAIQPGQAQRMAHAQRGFFTAQAGRWWRDGRPEETVTPHSLVWQGSGLNALPPETWHFEPLDNPAPDQPLGWWLGVDGDAPHLERSSR